MNVMFFLHSEKAFSNILEVETSKNFSLSPLACMTPYFCFTIALDLLVMHFTILHVFRGAFH